MRTNACTNAQQRQRGAALVIALIMLLVMTVLGLAAMQITRMEERMAGNTRDLNLAFQGAEAGLRDSEERICSGFAARTCNAAVHGVDPRFMADGSARRNLSWWTPTAPNTVSPPPPKHRSHPRPLSRHREPRLHSRQSDDRPRTARRARLLSSHRPFLWRQRNRNRGARDHIHTALLKRTNSS